VVITVNPLPLPSIIYFTASCFGSSGPITDTLCGLSQNPTGSTPTSLEYRIYAGKNVYFKWRTESATNNVTIGRFGTTPQSCVNTNGADNPPAGTVCATATITEEVTYILTAFNAAGAQTTRSIVFVPEVQPADPPRNLNLTITSGTVAGNQLTLALTWNYAKDKLSSIAGFRVIRTPSRGQAPVITDLTSYPYGCTTNSSSADETCTFNDTLVGANNTCGQTYQVATLYIGLGGELLASDSTYEVALDSCPTTTK
jgi:hypothetical protein